MSKIYSSSMINITYFVSVEKIEYTSDVEYSGQ